MCNCIQNTETELRAKLEGGDLSSIVPKGGRLKSLAAHNAALMFATGEWTLSIPFEAVWEIDGKKDRTTEVRMIASHCPFCGTPFTP